MMKECDHGNPDKEKSALILCFLLLYCPVPIYPRLGRKRSSSLKVQVLIGSPVYVVVKVRYLTSS